MYIHERAKWPNFTWNKTQLSELIAQVRYQQGRLLGRMDALGFQLRDEAMLEALTQDVVKTSEIEGEKFDTVQVRSSIAKRLGVDIGATLPPDRNVDGIVDITLDAARHYKQALTQERLFGWHSALFPTGRSGFNRIAVGEWRTQASGPMQVVSGPFGREKIHFEAPAFDRMKNEMKKFINWFNDSSEKDQLIKSAIAHFWFVTIHPFEDGNGRIARAIADMLLARSENSKQRFYSMSAQIQRERHDYYDILEQCQKGTLDITVWIEWFLNCLNRAIISADKMLQTILVKARFWQLHANEPFNERQRSIINRLLDGFNGKLNSSKWAKLTKCSQDTALRDINELIARRILIKNEAGGRSTSYQLCLPN